MDEQTCSVIIGNFFKDGEQGQQVAADSHQIGVVDYSTGNQVVVTSTSFTGGIPEDWQQQAEAGEGEAGTSQAPTVT